MGDHIDYSDGGACLGKIGKMFRNRQEVLNLDNMSKNVIERSWSPGSISENGDKGVNHGPNCSADHGPDRTGCQSAYQASS